MAFTSYVTAEEAQAYIDVFTPGNSVEEAALIRASYILDRVYRDRIVGSKTDASQDHEFPRNAETVIPDAVKHATVELALLEQDSSFDPYAVEAGVVSKSVQVGEISEATTYKDSTVVSTTALTKVDAILGAYIVADTSRGGISFVPIVRGF